MQVTVEDQSPVKKVLHIEIPEDNVTKELNIAYNQLKKTAKIKGFRPGKAPRSVLEGMFKKDVHADVTSKLIQSSFMEALKETKLDIIGQPRVDPPELDDKGPYKYDATIEIKPEIEEIDYKGLSLTKTLYKATDEEIDAQLQMVSKNKSTLEPIKEERPLQDGDAAILDYEMFKDGKPIEEKSKSEDFTMKVGSGIISEEFDKNIIGMNSGDHKEFEIHLPEDYNDTKLANLDITFKVDLKEIKEDVLPEINDELAKSLGDFNSLDDLKDKIRENLTQGYEKRIEHELNEQIFQELIEKTDFELPDTMVDYELDMIIADAERSFQASNITLEQVGLTREVMSEKYRETAEKQVRRHLILGRLIEQETMELTDEELETGYKDMSEMSYQPVENVKKFYEENSDKLQFFKHTLLEKKAIDLIIKNSTVEEKEPELEQAPEKAETEAEEKEE